jgi:hypothetical protein
MLARGVQVDCSKQVCHRTAQNRPARPSGHGSKDKERVWTVQFATVAVATLLTTTPAVAQELETTEATFNRSCAGRCLPPQDA